MSQRQISPKKGSGESVERPHIRTARRSEGTLKFHTDVTNKSSHRRQHSAGGSNGRNKRTDTEHSRSPAANPNKNLDFICPVCLDLIIEAHITRCGHTFCYRCISNSVEMFKRCPICSHIIATCEQIFPNYLLDELITKFRMKRGLQETERLHRAIGEALGGDVGGDHSSNADGLKNFLTTESQKLTLPDVNIILGILNQRKQLLEAESSVSQNRLLYDFLKYLHFQKKKKKEQIENEINLLEIDLAHVQSTLNDISMDRSCDIVADLDVTHNENVKKKIVNEHSSDADAASKTDDVTSAAEKQTTDTSAVPKSDTDNISIHSLESKGEAAESLAYNLRKRRMLAHFDEFSKSYFVIRNRDLLLLDEVTEKVDAPGTSTSDLADRPGDMRTKRSMDREISGLDTIRSNLVRSSKYGSLRQVHSMNYSNDTNASSTIVSTIVFDKDAEFFAIGGVTRRIKVFDYVAMVRENSNVRYPVLEMTSKNKISCLSWNNENKIAASDYIGGVNIWDVNTGTQIIALQEHKKRCWSVDFNEVDTRIMASGSDDGTVKLWSLNQDHSVATLETRANVCCVKFNPTSAYHLAFGSADQDVHYYDIRHFTKPLAVFRGHKKAVSYVKFLNGQQIISASTDSQLKCWNVDEPPVASRTFQGHLNEKNFVGLTTNGEYIACGSEDNAVYIYYKSLSKPLFCLRMDSNLASSQSNTFTGSGRSSHLTGFSSDSERFSEASVNDFVSAVTWRNQSNAIVAANSRGIIKVLELV